MHVIFLPYCNISNSELIKIIKDDEIKIFPATDDSATVSYGIKHHKIHFAHGTIDETLFKEYCKKTSFEFLGNRMSKGSIDKIPYTMLICQKGAEINQKNLDRLVEIINQENIKDGI